MRINHTIRNECIRQSLMSNTAGCVCFLLPSQSWCCRLFLTLLPQPGAPQLLHAVGLPVLPGALASWPGFGVSTAAIPSPTPGYKTEVAFVEHGRDVNACHTAITLF